MEKIKTLLVLLENPLGIEEVSKFRAAVIEATAREHDLFHNHKSDGDFHYRYPLIQYKSIRGQAGILCLGEATNVIHYFLGQPSINLRIGQRQESLSVDRVNLHSALLQTWTTDIDYQISNWQALSQKNFAEWKQLEGESLVAQLAFLERILTGNILSACTGLGFRVEDRLSIKIKRFKPSKGLGFKGQKVLTFNLDFSANISLPDYIGLGKGASVGLGVLQAQRKRAPKKEVPALEISNEE